MRMANGSMGVDAADYDQDGWLDLFISNVDHESFALYRNTKNDSFSDATMAVHGAKDGSLGDVRDLEPGTPCTDWTGCLLGPVGNTDGASGTLLVGLRAPDPDS